METTETALKTMTCCECGKKMTFKTGPRDFTVKGKPVTVMASFYECENCGEVAFTAPEVKRLDGLLL